MTKPRAISGFNPPRRLPRGRHALSPEQVLADQRQRLLEAVPSVVAERGYEAMTVADIVKKAAVSRNAFYRSFSDKQDCFASAHEACQEQLLAILTQACKGRQTFEQKVENALAAALDGLASHPDVARLLAVEAPSSAGEEIALRYHEWLRRYGAMLHRTATGEAAKADAGIRLDEVIVGGIASQIAGEVLQGGGAQLRDLAPQLREYVLAFYRTGGPDAGRVVALEPGQSAEAAEAPKRATV